MGSGWSKGSAGIGAKFHNRFRRHQGGGGVMLCSEIINNQLIVPVIVPAGVKITQLLIVNFLVKDFSFGLMTSLCHFGKRSRSCKIMRRRIQLKQLSNICPRMDSKTTI